MKIKYKYITGEVAEVEVSDEIGIEIETSRRLESNANRKERYHCYSLDTGEYADTSDYSLRVEFGYDFGEQDESEQRLSDILSTFNKLTEVQRRRLLKHMKGMNVRDIAAEEGVHFTAVEESILAARKKFKLFLK